MKWQKYNYRISDRHFDFDKNIECFGATQDYRLLSRSNNIKFSCLSAFSQSRYIKWMCEQDMEYSVYGSSSVVRDLFEISLTEWKGT